MRSIKATMNTPTGFRDRENIETVNILQFVYGSHMDAGGYDRAGSSTLAVILRSNGTIESVPISWLTVI